MHAVAGEHAVQAEGALAKVPVGQSEAEYAQEEAPAGLYLPMGQRVHAEEEFAPVDVEKEPAGQGAHVEGSAAPATALKVPAAHRIQVALEEAPVAADHVPAGQGTRFSPGERKGQYEPAGHNTGAPEEQ